MADFTRLRPLKASLTLAEIQQDIRNQEMVSQLIAISAFEGRSFETLTRSGPLGKPITLVRFTGSTIPAPPAGTTTLVCIGECFIEGADATVAAFR